MIAESTIRESAGQETPSCLRSAEAYSAEIPDCMMKVAGLHKDSSDFKKILNFQITDEIRNTSHNQLSRFEFPADDLGGYTAAASGLIGTKEHVTVFTTG